MPRTSFRHTVWSRSSIPASSPSSSTCRPMLQQPAGDCDEDSKHVVSGDCRQVIKSLRRFVTWGIRLDGFSSKLMVFVQLSSKISLRLAGKSQTIFKRSLILSHSIIFFLAPTLLCITGRGPAICTQICFFSSLQFTNVKPSPRVNGLSECFFMLLLCLTLPL